MRSAIKKAIESHVLAEYPREACGLLIAVGDKQQYVSCRNNATDDRDFQLSAADYAAAEDRGMILAVVHSHVDQSAKPSQADRVSCEATALPWHIVSVMKDATEDQPRIGEWFSFEPSGYQAPLVGRSFHHGSLDCYGLIRDFYRRELGISLHDFERENDWWTKPDHGELYLDNFARAGFVPVTGDPEYGDVVLMQYRSERTNHGGVYIGNAALQSQSDLSPMKGALLHHAMPRLSERVLYAGYWRDITRVIVRYEK